ncbi:hypothetical protein N7462_003361 [Penicillium macrosclerotiorum]|uniref:uncharacterized protein n=1 Tax=Penicillium macrosclerotiorum TaxID=303699 RepID=UPI002548B84A|nr:uncharacterized protein N7462_003361 [Penicillium macrosclerotiorum]KAJ5688969.1 hypothetical protein N7462_003361 [Penicillium macrosclerotiorum]
MSAPASSTPRGTAPNASQITASVIKFRCLYTHDLRRKSKRWQDGYLRYHAFNRRIMVYDDQGNYIGDHHWRSADEVQDGDELELDMGALIQVGERMSTTQADISNLFDKKKSIQGSPTSTSSTSLFQGPSRTSTPVRSSGSSQTFRSLNDLLGIKKTQIGRLISPYEERHPPAPSPDTPESSERALKRQKVSSFARHPDERGTFTKRTSQAEVVDLTEADGLSARQTQNHLPTKEIHRVQKESASKAQSGAGKSRDTEETPGSSKVDPPVFKKPAVPTPPDPSNQVTEAATSTKKPTTTTTTRDAPFELGARNARHPLPANPPRQSSENGPLNAPIKTLRMVSGKPRRKLMYSALIPTDTSQKSTPKSSFSSPTSRSQPLSDPLESQSVRTWQVPNFRG